MKISVPGLWLCCILATLSAFGQSAGANDTTLKGSVIEVIQAYKPKVKPAPKPLYLPQLPPADTAHLPVKYQVPQQTLYYSYTSEPLHPLALGKDTVLIPYPGYVKAGINYNLSTLYLDAGMGSLHFTDNDDASVHVHHMSQDGSIKYQQTALSGIEADDRMHLKDYDVHTGVYLERNQYDDYGYDHSLYDIAKDSVQHTYYSAKVVADLANKVNAGTQWSYDPKVQFSYFGDNANVNAKETSFNLDAPFYYKINANLQALVRINATAATFNYGGANKQDESFTELEPGINYHKGLLDAHAWLGFGSGRSTGYLMPDVGVGYNMKGTTMMLTGGLQTTYQENDFEQLTAQNPFIFSDFQVHPMTKTQLYVGLSGTSGAHIYYQLKAGWWSFNDMPTFLNDTLDQKQFYILYDNVTATSLQGSVRYVMNNTWSAGLAADLYKYFDGTRQYAWGQPSASVKADFRGHPIPALIISAYLSEVAGIYAMNMNKSVITQNAITDIGGYGEYSFKSNLSVFLQLNNLLNNKYTYYYGYASYGVNAYAGVRLKF